ncbi:transcription antitermination factor NusB [Orientia chuto str. Dubai]|uniref:Transcription antitermination factor NusB n=1 Tax=Orientia chuto str. Dubai TaxID=1359168 RepID=A0A0F3MR63_9RICK|nr:transcription antitermination factor NusB [Candidatus Orientia mediorientalis]KJV57074.1 transcription antitermination factor NusB [Orientia chuto str. Dubai]
MVKINAKTITRIASIQGVYSYQILKSEHTIDYIISFIITYYKDKSSLEDLELDSTVPCFKIKVNYLTMLINETISNLETIDMIISSHLANNWQIKDLHLMLLSILQVAICELKFFTNTPYKVIINEFTNIASDFVQENEIGFVNSLLEKVSFNVRSLNKDK